MDFDVEIRISFNTHYYLDNVEPTKDNRAKQKSPYQNK